MAKRHLLPLFVALFLGFLIGFISARYYPVPKSLTQKNDLLLPYQTTTKNISEQEQKQIEDFINKFYDYQQQRAIDKLVALFTPPSNKQEQDDLDFLLGKDLTRVSAKPQRLFTTQGFNYTIGGYYIRNIARHNDATTLLLDEMRTMYSGGEYVGYSANIAPLIMEVIHTNNKLQIVGYKHLQSSSKYEGFSAY